LIKIVRFTEPNLFEDLFVPWDRVFLAGEVQLASRLAQSLGLWERTGGLIETVPLSEIFVDLAQLVTEMQGKDRDPVAQSSIAELIAYAELRRMAVLDQNSERPTKAGDLCATALLSRA
jgi:4-hydroxybutyryl-CoA dehydratase/vinylacetyl-CoA-Delta-isomerase